MIKNALGRWNSRSYITSGNSFSGDEIKVERDTNTIVDYTFKLFILLFFKLDWDRELNKATITFLRISYSMINIEYVTIIVNLDSRIQNEEWRIRKEWGRQHSKVL